MLKRIGKVCIGLLALIYALPIIITALQAFAPTSEVLELHESISGEARSFGSEYARLLLPRAFSLEQYYLVLLSSSEYMYRFWVSLALAAFITLLNSAISLIIAFTLAKVQFKGRRLLLYLTLIVMMMPFQVTMLPNYVLARWLNIYDSWWALIIPQAFAPFGFFLLHQFMRTFPDEMLDAATLETGSPFVLLFQIIAPNIKPGIISLIILVFSENWNMVEQPMVLLETERLYPLALLVNNIKNQHVDIAFACSILYMLPMILLYICFNEQIVEGISVIDAI